MSNATVVLRSPVLPVTHVVVGVDGSAGSVAALYWAAAEAVRCQAGLRIVSAWQGTDQLGPITASHPAQAAARIVQTALIRILSRQDYPPRVACAALRGVPGEALLNQARDTGLLVLGATKDGDETPGATGRYCLRHGRGPLVLVPSPR
ncbi:MAG: universal stress protein [Trebonia sp.]